MFGLFGVHLSTRRAEKKEKRKRNRKNVHDAFHFLKLSRKSGKFSSELSMKIATIIAGNLEKFIFGKTKEMDEFLAEC